MHLRASAGRAAAGRTHPRRAGRRAHRPARAAAAPQQGAGQRQEVRGPGQVGHAARTLTLTLTLTLTPTQP
eukprot:scaffold83526_cov61-Phaeocystis_antarctica.AAC.1